MHVVTRKKAQAALEEIDEPDLDPTETDDSAAEGDDEADAIVVTGKATIRDYISGREVKATPEEIEAVQVFSQRLVEDYGYPKEHIQTRPQWRVRRSPAGGKTYPVDIAVFGGPQKSGAPDIVVECKRRVRKDGIEQLKLYMDLGNVNLGVWFNGEDHEYLRKVILPDGTRTWEHLPNIPRFGQRVEDIGRFRREDLVKPSNLRAVFRDLRNHLAGNVTGITRDEALAQQIVNVLFCKIYDEINTGMTKMVEFRAGVGEEPTAVQERITSLFTKVTEEYDDVFDAQDAITLDATSLVYVVGELQPYSIIDAERDAVGDAFEVFIGPALRGAEGQFFTPRNVVKLVIDALDPMPGETVIDPACGSGGFLIAALENVWQKLEAEGAEKGWSAVALDRKKRDVASKTFRGLDKDAFLAKVTKAYMAIIGDGRGGVFCENSLQEPCDWSAGAQERVKLGTFDVVMTNPPFGSKIRIKGESLLKQYDMGHKWKVDIDTGIPERTSKIHSDQPPQLLFLERCMQLLKPGGRLGIVLPESILGNPSYRHALTWLEAQGTVHFVATMPEPLFKTSGKGGTHTKVAVIVVVKHAKGAKAKAKRPDVFMGDALWCGHDSRGNPTIRVHDDGTEELLDDVPLIAERYASYRMTGKIEPSRTGFALPAASRTAQILVPKYYNPELKADLAALTKTHELHRIADLVAAGSLTLATGVEVGKMAYGTGVIPFIRTSDISNWEMKSDPKHGVSEALYKHYEAKTDVQEGDILMVRDGTYLIGTCAMVTAHDLPMLYQSHLIKMRVSEGLNKWLFFAAINTPIVKRQIRSKQFTQDIIDTLGNRFLEILVPIPKLTKEQDRIANAAQEIVEGRAALRDRAKELALSIVNAKDLGGDDIIL